MDGIMQSSVNLKCRVFFALFGLALIAWPAADAIYTQQFRSWIVVSGTMATYVLAATWFLARKARTATRSHE